MEITIMLGIIPPLYRRRGRFSKSRARFFNAISILQINRLTQ